MNIGFEHIIENCQSIADLQKLEEKTNKLNKEKDNGNRLERT